MKRIWKRTVAIALTALMLCGAVSAAAVPIVAAVADALAVERNAVTPEVSADEAEVTAKTGLAGKTISILGASIFLVYKGLKSLCN